MPRVFASPFLSLVKCNQHIFMLLSSVAFEDLWINLRKKKLKESKKLTLSASLSRSHSSFWSIINRRDLPPPPPPPHPILFVPFVTSPSHCCNFFFTVSKESNIGMMSSQVESNMRVESSIEVVTGGGLLDSSTVVESNMSFMELLATCEIGFKGSTESRTNVE
ncbi:hypothetical protein P8452_06162 [Trifolium repens]|nr:hypothetical protein P8452_06162 [Trifolium repens]